MSGVSIDVRIEDRGVSRAFARLVSAMADTTPIMAAIGTGLVASTHRRFVSQSDPQGRAWVKLNPGYRAIKRNSRILTESGRLRGSITRVAGRDSVRVGSNVIYAGVHQFGATIRPKAASHLVFRVAGGLAHARSVTIPPRPFLGISDDDRDMIGDIVFGAIERTTR